MRPVVIFFLMVVVAACSDDGTVTDCPSNLTLCNGACVDLMSDDVNCGECGAICGDSVCVNGVCDSTCPAGTVACGFQCCSCPDDPPEDQASCEEEGLVCTWQRCGTDGLTVADCRASTWSVNTETCMTHGCGGETCDPDELCIQRIGGALLTECGPNPCGNDPVEPSCACDICQGNPCTVTGLTVSCDTCPSGLCP